MLLWLVNHHRPQRSPPPEIRPSISFSYQASLNPYFWGGYLGWGRLTSHDVKFQVFNLARDLTVNRAGPRKVAFWKGIPLISWKSRVGEIVFHLGQNFNLWMQFIGHIGSRKLVCNGMST